MTYIGPEAAAELRELQACFGRDFLSNQYIKIYRLLLTMQSTCKRLKLEPCSEAGAVKPLKRVPQVCLCCFLFAP